MKISCFIHIPLDILNLLENQTMIMTRGVVNGYDNVPIYLDIKGKRRGNEAKGCCYFGRQYSLIHPTWGFMELVSTHVQTSIPT